MATATARKSKVYTISLPPELAQRAEALAQRDSRTMSELFREAFRTYSAQQARTMLDEYRSVGARVWDRFKRGREEQLWYFHELAKTFKASGRNRIVDELERVVAELERVSAGEDAAEAKAEAQP